ncbi:fungal-specific transcription factor domain-containing protein [Xylariaceae sp. FL0662B]|nr:fungal-specific transcription factor domain-containing protein [Xylariaceae sp. FL0662B]
MFNTFVGTPQPPTKASDSTCPPSDAQAGRSSSSAVSPPPESVDTSTHAPPHPHPPPKRKRQQVARACDWCRVHRIKCDTNVPCTNCKDRGGECSNKGAVEARTLPHAYREIERLRQQVKDLETQLKEERSRSNGAICLSSVPTPPSSSIASSSPADALNEVGGHAGTKRYWDGIYTSTAHSPQKTLYGPSSLFYFISRMNTYLTSVFQQLHLDNQIQLNSTAKAFAAPDSNLPEDDREPASREAGTAIANSDYLTPTQEEYFMNLFWQSYHSSIPVLNELEFKDHCKSLWETPGKRRRPSALVDIVIAMSMQYGMARIPRGSTTGSSLGTDIDSGDSSIAGRWYYRRCQRLLTNELESPSISTLQCQILCVTYLCCGSFQNMSHSGLALATRTAQMLGLHMEPPEDMPAAQREMRKRIWWSLYTLESKTSMKLGRPFSTDLLSTTCSLPADDHETAISAGSDFAPVGENVTWLTYCLQNTKLALNARAVHSAFYDKYSDIYSGDQGRVVYDDPPALERYAEFLVTAMQTLDTWAKAVPEALKTKREGHGEMFSTDRSALVIEQFAPSWLQRQRLLLELLYHNLTMNLYRPFITFPSASLNTPPRTPTARSHATSAINHGMALTHIMYQVLSETDILTGWHEAFQWQWNVALTLAGYFFAYPDSSIVPAVREAISRAIDVFDIFGRNFAVANSAALVMRDLATKADFLTGLLRVGDVQTPQALQNAPTGVGGGGGGGLTDGNTMRLMDDNNTAAMDNGLAMDMAFSVDSFNSLEMLWPAVGNTPEDCWGYNFG